MCRVLERERLPFSQISQAVFAIGAETARDFRCQGLAAGTCGHSPCSQLGRERHGAGGGRTGLAEQVPWGLSF